ncbi:glycosyltransferase family 2 protein [Methanobrevibacter sp. OttesenSCG-928-K11]|nr:glycosyltransferase family 2 protein [Methanobrevibacter sp. OttesenSCG-928-K11]MDL2271342.1 glycosyltransferase family 2 protein [Methanobrevibacter sp. OttesenSCG-928-I08]
MKVSVITPNFNGVNFLKNYFDSLEKEKNHIHEIIIIDNGSTDDSVDFINKIANNSELNIKIIENNQNMGFSKAINQGIKLSTSGFVFLLNNDVEVEKETISNLIKLMNSKKDAFSISSKMIQYNNRDLIDDAGDEYNILAYTKKSGNGTSVNNYTENREIFSSCAGAALYKKSVFDKIGLFDENFFAYVEDIDIGYRAQIFGFKNYYAANSIVYHIGSATSGTKYNEFKIKIAARNNVWLIYKNFPIPQKILNIGFLAIGFLTKYLFFYKKGYGSIYLEGLKEGLNSRDKIQKVKFHKSNLKNYFKIEWKLLKNTLTMIKK